MNKEKQTSQKKLTDYQQEYHISRKAHLQDLGIFEYYIPEDEETVVEDNDDESEEPVEEKPKQDAILDQGLIRINLNKDLKLPKVEISIEGEITI